jgi:sugar lactone lactonase YvrE
MDDGEREASGALYRLDPNLDWQRMDRGYVVSNGPAFSPDYRTLYHSDTAKGTIHAFDLSRDGKLANKRDFVTIPEGDGYPDGMTCDAQGGLWVAHWNGWRLTRFTPAGAIDRVIEMPVAQVTSCTFGGPDLDRLYVTSAAINLDAAALERQPLAGGLFEIDVGVKGFPAGQFGG